MEIIEEGYPNVMRGQEMPKIGSLFDPPDAEERAHVRELLGVPTFEQSVRRHTDRIADVLVEKNKSYGDSALNPVRIFSKADRMEQLYTRLDDKISRVKSGHEYPGDDTIQDIIGYCILILIARESN